MPPAPNPIPIGQRIAELLDGINQTPAWLAETSGLERSTITRAIKGERQPTAETLATVAPVLGVTLAQLIACTDAAARVKGVEELISRKHYEGAIRDLFDCEARSNNAEARARQHEEESTRRATRIRDLQRQIDGMNAALSQVEAARNEAERRASTYADDAQRYREGLEKAVRDVASLREQVRELGQSIDESKRTGRITAIIASVAAAASIAQYLRSDDHPRNAGAPPRKAPRKRKAPRNSTSNG
jgi:transcriptional regulator with XRE-family HTH domain